jgi:hypothetical protein
MSIEATMPIRFRRTIKILPGVKLNLSKGGMSVTVGPKGYHLNFGKKGVQQTIDLPGVGLSHTSYLFDGDDDKEKTKAKNGRREKRDSSADDDNDAVGCFPFGCLLFVLVAAVAGYFVADANQWIPEDYLSNLMQQVTLWLQSAGR